jgi:hypothetical protein
MNSPERLFESKSASIEKEPLLICFVSPDRFSIVPKTLPEYFAVTDLWMRF